MKLGTRGIFIPFASLTRLWPLDEVGNVGRKLLNDRVVEALDVLEHPLVIADDKVDGNSLAAKAAGTTDTVEVVLRLGGEVIVNDQGDLRQE